MDREYFRVSDPASDLFGQVVVYERSYDFSEEPGILYVGPLRGAQDEGVFVRVRDEHLCDVNLERGQRIEEAFWDVDTYPLHLDRD